jgi:hypothetical protein
MKINVLRIICAVWTIVVVVPMYAVLSLLQMIFGVVNNFAYCNLIEDTLTTKLARAKGFDNRVCSLAQVISLIVEPIVFSTIDFFKNLKENFNI